VKGRIKYYILSIETVFGLHVVADHCPEFPKFEEKNLLLKFCPCPLSMQFYIWNIWTCV